jgi:branched-subunit amino acid aminotransferase/4-amino-4-deoxychorismate lyase
MSDAPLAVAVSGRGLVDPDEPVLLADDEGFLRGRAAFETLRVYGGRPFRLAQHLARLAQSSERIGLAPPDLAEVEALAAHALAAARKEDSVLRLYWTPGRAASPRGTAIALVSDVPDWIEPVRARGQRLVCLLYPRRSSSWLLAGTKSTSYAVHLAAEAEAQRRGGDDAVFVDADGIVLEGPVTNVWWRRGRTLFTPALELGILAGETRAALTELAPSLAYAVEEGAYPVSDLHEADEVFTSSSVREVLPAAAVDGRPVGRGPAADELQAALRAAAGPAAPR